jgi:hypothetical protein
MPNYLDDLIRRVGDSASAAPQMRAAADAVYSAQSPGWQKAQDLLHMYPKSLSQIDEFMGDNKMTLGRPLGAGSESLVFAANPAFDEAPQVLKVRVGDALQSDFDFPKNVPGIAPYWASTQAGPNVAAALQPRADMVYKPVQGWEKPFKLASERLKQSLLARGWHWMDGHLLNAGLMPDGNWNAVDGFVDIAHPSLSRPNISPEEAIRMLRSTPEERAAIFGTVTK